MIYSMATYLSLLHADRIIEVGVDILIVPSHDISVLVFLSSKECCYSMMIVPCMF